MESLTGLGAPLADCLPFCHFHGGIMMFQHDHQLSHLKRMNCAEVSCLSTAGAIAYQNLDWRYHEV